MRVPFVVGVNLTVTVQLARPAREAPQLFVCEKSPDAAIEVMLTAPLPVLLMVIVSGAEVDETAVFGKVSDAGLKLSEVVVPVPLSGTL